METYCERLTQELFKLQPVEVVALPGRSDGQPPSVIALLLFPFTVLRRLLALKDAPQFVHLGDMAIWPLALMTLARFPRARIVLSAHGTDVSYGARGGMRGNLYSAYLKAGARMLSHATVIANSRATRSRVKAAGWRRVAVVPLAADQIPLPSTQVRRHTILFAGRLIKRKGCSWFVREVLPLCPDHRLLIAGTRWDPGENAALEHPRVEFLGPQSQAELARLYAEAGTVVVPNIEVESGEYEGFGLVAPEAANAGGVVLASNHGGLIDAVIDGQTGFLLPSGDAKAWAEKISEVTSWSEAKRADFKATSQHRARDYYSWSRVALQTYAAYELGEVESLDPTFEDMT
ncbi:glycosyltransferase family 4 protein [Erythrobacter sp.]|uniref:glycosyltransferase family 4 protein n=1 Tax=Erythrobacter sp. TaxID=1042 RepID=UPI002EAD6323|nr:glycosyltransferase family 4 protein [Erythrobacter sp.]